MKYAAVITPAAAIAPVSFTETNFESVTGFRGCRKSLERLLADLKCPHSRVRGHLFVLVVDWQDALRRVSGRDAVGEDLSDDTVLAMASRRGRR